LQACALKGLPAGDTDVSVIAEHCIVHAERRPAILVNATSNQVDSKKADGGVHVDARDFASVH
jgi:hypothetical protein